MKLYIILLAALFCLAAVSMGDEAEYDVSDVTANVNVDFEVNGLQTLDGKKCKPSKKYCEYSFQCCSGKCKIPPNPMNFKIELIGKCK